MTGTTSWLTQRSSSSMQVESGLVNMVWENDEIVKRPPFPVTQRTTSEKMYEHHHQDYYNFMYLMSGNTENKTAVDSHVVPDEDDFKYDHHHLHHHQVAPKVDHHHRMPSTTHGFDLNHDLNDDLNDDAALAMIMIINSKTGVTDIAERLDHTDVVVPHQHDDCELPASKHPPNSDPNSKLIVPCKPNEAEPALVPSLSVCSNDLPCDHRDQNPEEEEQSEQTLTSAPVKRKSSRATTTKAQKRKRRTKMDRKLQALQGLLPNCNEKADRASILDEAIVYVKTLQLQLQMMSMPFPMIGLPPFVAPPLLLPHHHHHLPTPITAHRFPNFSVPTFP